MGRIYFSGVEEIPLSFFILSLARSNRRTVRTERRRQCFPVDTVCMRCTMVQWLTTCLATQGTLVRLMVQEYPTCSRATKPMRPNY